MSTWDFVFGHMATDAVFRASRACCAGMIARALRTLGRKVASETAIVVGPQIALQRLVRVMAGKAGDSGVSLFPATAEFEAVRLKAYGCDPFHAALHDVCPRTMASATEVHGIDGFELGRIQHARQALRGSSRLHGCDMACARPVASLAGDSRDEMSRIQSASSRRSRIVAAEAKLSFLCAQASAQCLIDI